jgi:hypothetical protein
MRRTVPLRESAGAPAGVPDATQAADIHEPVELYRSFYKEKHVRNTSEYFEELVRRSGVDERANMITVKELRELEEQTGEAKSKSLWYKILRGAVIAVLLLALLIAYANSQPLWLILAAAATFAWIKLNPFIRELDAALRTLEARREKKREEAWAQMAPLNQLYEWHIAATLVRRTAPRLEIDPYFSNARLQELRDSFGFGDASQPHRSVVCAHSGVLNGNPFVLADTLNHWMGSKTYTGSLQISWTERVRDSNGQWTTNTRYQTLTASVTKPYPEYGKRTRIIYGNEAAPDLTFTREPSSLSSLEDGMFNNWRKGRAVKKLEAKARDLKGGRGFTPMANREFDSLFGATDRDHEVQFRLLFTPLAQQEMVKLLKDKAVAYGDDFSFEKRRMINVVEPAHLGPVDISSDPALFFAYELAHARRTFNEYHNTFFKALYFGLAPLLTIPLYQQHRSHADIYRDVLGRKSCYWEHESLVNYLGGGQFSHSACITQNILKTSATTTADGAQELAVTAYGYRGVDRLDYVRAYGNDGRYHNVPVRWVEYLPVAKESRVVLKEDEQPAGEGVPQTDDGAWQGVFARRGVDSSAVVFRRSIRAAISAR